MADRGLNSAEGDLFGLLGVDCRRLKLEKVSQGFFRANSGFLSTIAARNDRLGHLPEPRNPTLSYTNTWRQSVKHSFSFSLPQEVVLKYA
jgi:hypothetical protein